MTPISCPSCEQEFHVGVKSCLEQYKVTMRIDLSEAKPLPAERIAEYIKNAALLFTSSADDCGHSSIVSLLGVDVSEGLCIKIHLSVLPFERPSQPNSSEPKPIKKDTP